MLIKDISNFIMGLNLWFSPSKKTQAETVEKKITAIEINYDDLISRFSVPGKYSWAELFDYFGSPAFDGQEMLLRPEATEILKICEILKDLGYEYRSNTDEENERWGYSLDTEVKLDYDINQVLPTYCSHP